VPRAKGPKPDGSALAPSDAAGRPACSGVPIVTEVGVTEVGSSGLRRLNKTLYQTE
jgi:hypothetical protein